MTIRDEGPDLQPIIRLTVTLAPGATAPLVVELMNAIRGQPEVADVTWDLADTEKNPSDTEKLRADRELSDRIMWLLGQVAPV